MNSALAKPPALALVSGDGRAPLCSLLYVSHSTIAERDAEHSVKQIVELAEARNGELGLTGALLFTGKHFAQVLEGERSAIDVLWSKLFCDPRHDRLTIVERAPLPERRFADWGMAFYGPSHFITQHVARLSHSPSPSQYSRTAAWLNELLRPY